MRVCAQTCEYARIEAIVVIEAPRLLHRRSEYGYTRTVAVALSCEPEAVDEDQQERITRAAADRELRTWLTTRKRLLEEIEHLRVHVHDPHVDRACRALVREIEALDRKLTE